MRVGLIAALVACSGSPPSRDTGSRPQAPVPAVAVASPESDHCHGESPLVLVKAVGVGEASARAGIGIDVVDVGCACLEAGARIAIVWVEIDRSHRLTVQAWSDRPTSATCFEAAFGAARASTLADVQAAFVFQDDDHSRAVTLPGPYTKAALAMTIVGDPAGALWSASELETTLAVAGEDIARCAKSRPARTLVLIDIQDSRFVRARVASAAGVDDACVDAALVGKQLYRAKAEPPRDAALVLELAWQAP